MLGYPSLHAINTDFARQSSLHIDRSVCRRHLGFPTEVCQMAFATI